MKRAHRTESKLALSAVIGLSALMLSIGCGPPSKGNTPPATGGSTGSGTGGSTGTGGESTATGGVTGTGGSGPTGSGGAIGSGETQVFAIRLRLVESERLFIQPHEQREAFHGGAGGKIRDLGRGENKD